MTVMTLQGFVGAADGVTASFLSQTYPALANAVSAPVYSAAILYWALYGYKIFAGYAPVQWNVLLSKVVMTALVLGTLSWGGLAQMIYNAFVSFMESAASTIMAGKPTAQMVDALWSNVDAVSQTLRKADYMKITTILDGLLLFAINCILFIIALGYMTIAKFGLAITMVLLPLFIGFAMFDQTRHWFTNWANKMLSFALMYILVIAIVRFGFLAFGDIIEKTDGVVSGDQTSQLFIVEGVLILFMLGVRGWAGQLASGATSSSGALVAMIRTATKGVR